MVGFLFPVPARADNRWIAAAFYVWLSTFNLLTISVFWSLMADIFSKRPGQAAVRLHRRRRHGRAPSPRPAFVTFFVKAVGTNTLLLISAAGFAITAFLVRRAGSGKAQTGGRRCRGAEDQPGPKAGRQPVRRLRAAVPVALPVDDRAVPAADDLDLHGDLFPARRPRSAKNFASRAARTQAYATIDLATNSIAVLIQLFGTGRFIKRFGVTTGLLLNPVIMVVAFLAVAFSPVLLVLGSIQVVRRVRRICRRQAQPRHAVHRGRPAGQIQGQERHRDGGLSLWRSHFVLDQRRRCCPLASRAWRSSASSFRCSGFPSPGCWAGATRVCATAKSRLKV